MFLLLVTIVLLFSGMAHAQQITSSISGIVIDENKSLVPNAAVTIESPQLALRRNTTTNDEGYFIVPDGRHRLCGCADD